MIGGYGAPIGQPKAILMAPVAEAQAAGALRQALEQAGWQVIIAPDPRSYAASARACVVIVSPQNSAGPEVSAAIGAGFTTLIPVMTTPMPVPYAQWAMAPVLMGADAAQQRIAATAVLQKLASLAPAAASAPTPATPSTPANFAPSAPVTAPPATPFYAPQAVPPSMPLYAAQPPAAPSTPLYPQQPPPGYAPPSGYAPQPGYAPPSGYAPPGYAPPGYAPQPYGAPGAYPTTAPKPSGFPGWARNLIIIGVIAVVVIGGLLYANSQHLFNPNALSGHWSVNMTINDSSSQNNTQAADLSLTENGSQLSGTLSFTGASIPMTGTFSGQNVTLDGTLTDSSGQTSGSFEFKFNGVASSDDQTMQGPAQYVLKGIPNAPDATYSGSWTANRSSGNSARSTSRLAASTRVADSQRV
jgi:hypothetical protein